MFYIYVYYGMDYGGKNSTTADRRGSEIPAFLPLPIAGWRQEGHPVKNSLEYL